MGHTSFLIKDCQFIWREGLARRLFTQGYVKTQKYDHDLKM